MVLSLTSCPIEGCNSPMEETLATIVKDLELLQKINASQQALLAVMKMKIPKFDASGLPPPPSLPPQPTSDHPPPPCLSPQPTPDMDKGSTLKALTVMDIESHSSPATSPSITSPISLPIVSSILQSSNLPNQSLTIHSIFPVEPSKPIIFPFTSLLHGSSPLFSTKSLPLPAFVLAITPSQGSITAAPTFASSRPTPATVPSVIYGSPPALSMLNTSDPPPLISRVKEKVFDGRQAQGGGGGGGDSAAMLLNSLNSSLISENLALGCFPDALEPGVTSVVIPRSLS